MGTHCPRPQGAQSRGRPARFDTFKKAGAHSGSSLLMFKSASRCWRPMGDRHQESQISSVPLDLHPQVSSLRGRFAPGRWRVSAAQGQHVSEVMQSGCTKKSYRKHSLTFLARVQYVKRFHQLPDTRGRRELLVRRCHRSVVILSLKPGVSVPFIVGKREPRRLQNLPKSHSTERTRPRPLHPSLPSLLSDPQRSSCVAGGSDSVTRSPEGHIPLFSS